MLIPEGTHPKFQGLMELFGFGARTNLWDYADEYIVKWQIGYDGDPSVGIPAFWTSSAFDTLEELVAWTNTPEGYAEFRADLVEMYGEYDIKREEEFLARSGTWAEMQARNK